MQDNWQALLPLVIIAINNHTTTSTGMSPFFATHSYHIDPIEINKDIPLQTSGSSPITKAEAFIAQLQETSDLIQALIASAQECQEHYTNRNRRPAEQF